MAQLDKAAYEAKYNDPTTGIYRDGQAALSITEADTRADVEDSADSMMFLDDNFIDEDSFASDSATKAPSQQSVKAYVDSVIPGITSVTYEASSAEVLTAWSTGIELVASPGSGFVIHTLSPIMTSLDYGGVPYITHTSFKFTIGNDITGSIAGFLGGVADRVIQTPIASVEPQENQPLMFTVLTGDPTAGNSPVTFSFIYKVIQI